MARDSWGFPPSRPRAADGIKARSKRGSIGETWWSRRFVDVLEALGMGGRLGRARSYARSGQVLEVEIGAGDVRASVQGSRPRPYSVILQLDAFTEAQWDDAVRAMRPKE